jgi:hypothetical protein
MPHFRFVHFVSLASAFLFLVSGLPTVCFAQKTLAWKLPKGRIVRVQIDQVTKMKLLGLPESKASLASNTTHQKTDLTWAVLDVGPDKISRVEQAVTRIVFEMQSAGLNFVIDTNEPKPQTGLAETMSKSFLTMAGANFIVSTKSDGEIVDWTISDETKKKLGEGENEISESGMKELSMNSTMRLPLEPLRVGDNWQQSYDLEMRAFGKFVVTTTYQYLGEEAQNGLTLDKIRASTSMRAVNPDVVVGIKLNKQESGGTIWFNNEIGCIDHSEFLQDIAMDVNQAGLEIKQTVKQELKLKFTANP